MIILESKPGIFTGFNPLYIKFFDSIPFKHEDGRDLVRLQVIFNGDKEILQVDITEEVYTSFIQQFMELKATLAQLKISQVISKFNG